MSFFRRIMRLIRGFLGLFIGGIEKSNPKALLDAHIQEFQKNQATFNQNLAKQDAFRRRLELQLQDDRAKEAQLVIRIKALMKAGKATLAGQLAGQRKMVQANITENERQLQAAEEQFQQLTRQRDIFVKQSMTKIETVRGKISQAEMANAQAKLSEMASELTFNPDGQGLSDLEKSLNEQITNAQGRTRVAAEANSGNAWVMSEVEHEVLEQDALSEFAAEFDMVAAIPVEPQPMASLLALRQRIEEDSVTDAEYVNAAKTL